MVSKLFKHSNGWIGMSKIIDSGSIKEGGYFIAMEALGSSLKDVAQK